MGIISKFNGQPYNGVNDNFQYNDKINPWQVTNTCVIMYPHLLFYFISNPMINNATLKYKVLSPYYLDN